MSSTSPAEIPDRLSASPAAYRASSNVVTSRSVPLRAVPIGVRAAATMTASVISPPGKRFVVRQDYLTCASGPVAGDRRCPEHRLERRKKECVLVRGRAPVQEVLNRRQDDREHLQWKQRADDCE